MEEQIVILEMGYKTLRFGSTSGGTKGFGNTSGGKGFGNTATQVLEKKK